MYNPRERPNPLEALEDRYFEELRNQNTRLPNGQPLPPNLFQFTQEEKDYCEKIGQPDIIDNLLPNWYKQQLAKEQEFMREHQMRLQQEKRNKENLYL